MLLGVWSGEYTEKFHVTTLIGLLVVIAGFYTYETPVLEEEEGLRRLSLDLGRRVSVEDLAAFRRRAAAAHEEEEEGVGREAAGVEVALLHVPTSLLQRPVSAQPMMGEVPSFQERVVAGLGPILVRPQVIDSPGPPTAHHRNNK